MADPRAVLVTRPLPDAEATAARVAALGWHPLLAPALRIELREFKLPEGAIQAVLLTSANAVASLPASLHGRPLLAVGDATAARARAAGFWRVSSAGRDAAALAALLPMAADPERGPLLLVVGEGQGMPLAAAARERGFQVVRRVGYAARPLGALPAAATEALRDGLVGAALFFSAMSAQAFGRAVARHRLGPAFSGVRAIALSPAVAAALPPLPFSDVRVASRPTQDELLACLT